MEGVRVTMTCMTTKEKFEAVDPAVIVLANGRYAYREKCPWSGKSGQPLYAFKFCSRAAFDRYTAMQESAREEEEVASSDADEEKVAAETETTEATATGESESDQESE